MALCMHFYAQRMVYSLDNLIFVYIKRFQQNTQQKSTFFPISTNISISTASFMEEVNIKDQKGIINWRIVSVILFVIFIQQLVCALLYAALPFLIPTYFPDVGLFAM